MPSKKKREKKKTLQLAGKTTRENGFSFFFSFLITGNIISEIEKSNPTSFDHATIARLENKNNLVYINNFFGQIQLTAEVKFGQFFCSQCSQIQHF
jgi:hypothetical protein